MALSVGELVLDRYVIESLIGQGGMGEVYRARHQTLGMPVAVKAVTGSASPELTARFTREAQLLARVRHPNVVSILDVGRTLEGTPCMVMEFLEGEALDSRLERRGAFPWREVRAVALAVLKGLTAIHGAGIVHRDLKPANVLITRGSPSVVKIVDFGIAQPTGDGAAKMTRTGSVIGTPAYMSPEQLVGGDVDARSDIYALGLMLYELATGKLPFGDDPNGALQRLASAAIPRPIAPRPLPALPDDAVQAILGALVVDRDKRPQSARAFINVLRGGSREFPDVQVGGGEGPGTQHVPAHGTQAAAPPRTHFAPQQARPPAPPGTQAVRPATQVAQGYASAPPPPPAPQQATGYAPAGTRLGQAPAVMPQERESYAMYEPAPSPTAYVPSAQAGPSRALIAARIPVSRLGQREEQRALAQLAAPGRAYHLGGGMWFAIIPATSDDGAAEQAQRVSAALQKRYGDTCRILWAPASPAFALTPASLSGAAPLPPEIATMLDQLLTM
jgi:serine/threonine-protein kinase